MVVRYLVARLGIFSGTKLDIPCASTTFCYRSGNLLHGNVPVDNILQKLGIVRQTTSRWAVLACSGAPSKRRQCARALWPPHCGQTPYVVNRVVTALLLRVWD